MALMGINLGRRPKGYVLHPLPPTIYRDVWEIGTLPKEEVYFSVELFSYKMSFGCSLHMLGL